MARAAAGASKASNRIAAAFMVAAAAALLLSAFVMASRPWGCSISSESPVMSCDWNTSKEVAAGWLVFGLVVCFVAWKRLGLLLALVAFPLLAISLVSALGIFSVAPAALWLCCAFWLLSRGRRGRMIASAIASVVLLYLATNAVGGMIGLYSAPV